jgi:hypothetical protein
MNDLFSASAKAVPRARLRRTPIRLQRPRRLIQQQPGNIADRVTRPNRRANRLSRRGTKSQEVSQPSLVTLNVERRQVQPRRHVRQPIKQLHVPNLNRFFVLSIFHLFLDNRKCSFVVFQASTLAASARAIAAGVGRLVVMAPVIHVYSMLSLGRSRGDLEDDIQDRFGGEVEVTGGGQGQGGWNVDLELLDEGADVHRFATILVTFLQKWGVPSDTYLKVFGSGWVEGQEPTCITVFGSRPGP